MKVNVCPPKSLGLLVFVLRGIEAMILMMILLCHRGIEYLHELLDILIGGYKEVRFD